MTVVAGPFFATAALLGGAGVAKLIHPASTLDALRSARLPGMRPRRSPLDTLAAGRTVGVIELAAAVAASLVGGRVAAAVIAAFYVGFALFTARILHTAGAGASCGCFGAGRSPAAPLHVVVNGAIAAVAALAVVWPTHGLTSVVRDQPLAGLPFIALCAVLAWLLFALLTAVPELQAAVAGTTEATPSGSPGPRAR